MEYKLAMAPHSSTLAWKIPWTEDPGGLLSLGSHRVGHDWSDLAAAASFINSILINQQCKINHVLYLKNTRQQQRTDFFSEGPQSRFQRPHFQKLQEMCWVQLFTCIGPVANVYLQWVIDPANMKEKDQVTERKVRWNYFLEQCK